MHLSAMQQTWAGSNSLRPEAPDSGLDQQAQYAAHDQLQQQAILLSNQPVMHKLLSNKDAVSQLAAKSPVMQRMLNLNPVMRDMLQPEAMTRLLQAAQNPQALQNLLGMRHLPIALQHPMRS